jgi:predicted DNA binding protein
MLRATIYLDLQCECILSEVTTGADAPFDVAEEEVIDDEYIRFVIDAGADREGFERRLRADDAVTEVERVGDTRLVITKRSCGALPVIRENHGMLHGMDKVDGSLRVFDVVVFRRDDLKAIVADLRELGSVRIGKLTPHTTPRTSLSPRQEEVLRLALRAGYFEWPRRADAETLAAELDITHTTFLEHLRKAERKLLAEALPTGGEQQATAVARGRRPST